MLSLCKQVLQGRLPNVPVQTFNACAKVVRFDIMVHPAHLKPNNPLKHMNMQQLQRTAQRFDQQVDSQMLETCRQVVESRDNRNTDINVVDACMKLLRFDVMIHPEDLQVLQQDDVSKQLEEQEEQQQYGSEEDNYYENNNDGYYNDNSNDGYYYYQ